MNFEKKILLKFVSFSSIEDYKISNIFQIHILF